MEPLRHTAIFGTLLLVLGLIKFLFEAAAKMYDPGNVLRYYMVEHCPAKAALSGTMGYALGGFLGLFMHGAEQSAAPAKGNSKKGL